MIIYSDCLTKIEHELPYLQEGRVEENWGDIWYHTSIVAGLAMSIIYIVWAFVFSPVEWIRGRKHRQKSYPGFSPLTGKALACFLSFLNPKALRSISPRPWGLCLGHKSWPVNDMKETSVLNFMDTVLAIFLNSWDIHFCPFGIRSHFLRNRQLSMQSFSSNQVYNNDSETYLLCEI